MKCPGFEQLLDRIEGRLDPPVSARLDRHRASCNRCRDTQVWAEKIIRLMRSNKLTDAPEPVVQKALKAFAARKVTTSAWIPAHLEFDSWSVPMQGTRSTDRGPRQWVYTSEHYRVILQVETHGKKHTLIGQLTATTPEFWVQDCLVEATSRSKTVSSHITSERGEFFIQSVPGRDLELRIHTESESILIPLAI